MVEAASRKGMRLDIRLMPRLTHDAPATAAAVRAELGQVVKTVVVVAPRPGGRLVPIVCLVSGGNELDPGLLAAAAGEVSVRHATAAETLDLTGFLVGGVPPFGHGGDVKVLMDQDLCRYQSVWAAAGAEGAVFRISPRILRMLANAVVAPFAGPSWMYSPAVHVRPAIGAAAGSGAQSG